MNLFEQQVEDQKLHPNFKNIFVARNRYALDVLQGWAQGFEDRDGKFVKEFQTTFNSSFWELYLHAVFKKLNCSITFDHYAPDFNIEKPQQFCIEATIASNPDGEKKEHQANFNEIPHDLNELNRQAVIRITNSLVSKARKYVNSYKYLEHVTGKPFVLAIAPFDRPFFNLECQRPIEAALHGYYVNEEEYIEKNDYSNALNGDSIDRVSKDNGSLIELGIFNDPQYSFISAVMFSSTATWGKAVALSNNPNPVSTFKTVRQNMTGTIPHYAECSNVNYRENLFDGLRVYHNHNAERKLDVSLFSHKSIFQSYFVEKDQQWFHQQHEGQLLYRRLQTVV